MTNILKLLFFILFCTSTLFSQKLQKISLQQHWLNQFQFAGYYMAKEKGFYKDVGLDVEIREYNNSTNVLNEVQTGKATYGIGRSNLIIETANGANIKLLFSPFQSSPSVLIATKKSGIKNIKDFIGKKVMMTDSVLSSASFYAMINQHHVHLNDIQLIAPSFNINDLIKGKIDLMASYISNEPFELDKQKIAYSIFNPKDHGFDFYSDILFTSTNELNNNTQRAINFKNASLKGWEYAFSHIQESVNIIFSKYNTQNKSEEALVYEAKELKKLAYYKTDKLGNIDKKKIQKIYDIYQILGLTRNKIDLDTLVFTEKIDEIMLTSNEKKWIKENPVLKFSQINWEPLSIIENGKIKGIVSDYLNIISQRTGLNFKYIPADSWQQVLEKYKNKELDILPGGKYISNEKDMGLPSNIYKRYPMAIITNMNYKYIDSLNSLNGKTMALPLNYTSHNYIKKNFPSIKIITTKSVEEALFLVQGGRAEAFLGHMATSLSYLYKLQLKNLKISGTTNFDFEHVLYVHEKDKVLLSIINKALDSITVEEKNKIDKKWINIIVEPKIDYLFILSIVVFFVFIIIILIYRSRKLNNFNIAILKKDEELKLLNKKLQKNIDFVTVHLEKAQKIAKIGTWEYNIKKDQLTWSDEIYNILKIDQNKEPASSMSDFKKIIHPDDLKNVLKMYNSHLKNNNPYLIVHRAITKDNCLIYLEERCETTFDKNKNPLVSIGTVQDVTQQQLALLELRKKDEHILQQSRLVQMGEMLSMIAHQWRQPLSAISATTSNLRLKIMLDEIDIKMFEQEISLISNYTQHLSKTIDDFRDFLNDKSKIKITTLEEIVVSSLLIVEKSLESKNIVIDVHFTCNQTIKICSSEIKQVLLNLYKNAEDALLHNKIKNPKISIKTIIKDNHPMITVYDNAGGISSQINDKVFEPYFSTKKKRDGTGLGLYMSKIIVEEHCNGKLYFKSDKNGTTFFIEFCEKL